MKWVSQADMISLLINMKPSLFSQFSNINYLQEVNEVTMKTSSNYQKQFKSYFNIFVNSRY